MSPRTRSWPSSGARSVAPAGLVLDIGATADLDVATTDMLASLLTDVHDSGIDLRLAQVRGSVRDRMRRTGLMTVIGEERVYFSVEAAVAAPLPPPLLTETAAGRDAAPDDTTTEPPTD